jgi:hypothetical protein
MNKYVNGDTFMPYNTITTWNPLPPREQISVIHSKLDEMIARGLTDGTRELSYPNGVGIAPRIATRTWTTIEAAQEWKTFQEAATPVTPESVVIPV